MNVLRRASFAILLSSGLGLAHGQTAPDAVTPATYPQIVRVSFVQGDVRVSRGKDGKKATGAAWEQAQADLPLADGYSLVTGAGRAEIEFEDASTVYLAENSVLTFNSLSSTGGVPRTELGLLSGTATLNVQPMAAGERFSVVTPTDRITVKFPDKTFVRVDSYLDAMALTSMGSTIFRVERTAAFQSNGTRTVVFRNGKRIFPEEPPDQAKFADWNQWVISRAQDRQEASHAVMEQAGLTEPVPGLAEMNGQGTFYACAPYGMCWEPADGWAGKPSAAMAAQTVSVAALRQGGATAAPNRLLRTEFEDDYFPCAPVHVRNTYQIDPATGKRRLLRSEAVPGSQPWLWAVCHTGSWIRDRRHYVWVAGHKRHHHPPLHWVQLGSKRGFVPTHPLDVKGKPPLNLKDGIYRLVDRKGEGVERVAYDGKEPVKVLDEAPKEFLREYFEPLRRASEPHAAAHELNQVAQAHSDRVAGLPITFDRKSQSFMVAREVPQGGGSRMVSAPVGGRESAVQPRSGGDMGRGESRAAPSYSGGGETVSHAASPPPAPAPSAPAPSVSSSAAKTH